MKKLIIGLAIVIGILSAGPVRAEPVRLNPLRNIGLQTTSTLTPKPSFKPMVTGLIRENRESLIERLKDKIKKFFGLRFSGIVSSVSDKLLVVKTKEGKEWNVHLTDKTQIKRRFGGHSTVTEFVPNDEIAVIGRRQKATSGDPSETDMEAVNIRNLSIQRRNTVFIGDITGVNVADASFTIETKARGVQTVYKTKETTVTEKDRPITFESLTVGDRVIVKGELWDRANTKINAQKIMKLSFKLDQSLSPTPTP